MSKISTHPSWLQATQLTYTLPDGRTPLAAVDIVLPYGATGLVGRNGIGKSLLGALLAGTIQPASGRIERLGRIAHLMQRTGRKLGSVAELLGCAAQFSALRRIAQGSCEPADFDTVGDNWDLPERTQLRLQQFALDYLSPDDPAERLSGGELARLELIALLLRDPEHLILDEPSNHLDRNTRHLLGELIGQWRGGLLLISHDRELLEQMSAIYLMDELGLHRYGGNYSHFAQCREQEREALVRQIEQGKAELQRQQQLQRALQERQQRRLAQGRRERQQSNQAKILLDRQRERSEHGTARLKSNQSARLQRSSSRLHQLEQRLVIAEQMVMALPPITEQGSRSAIDIEAVSFGYHERLIDNLTYRFMAGGRYLISGANGSGKSTLLRLLTGDLNPVAGRITIRLPWTLIDQQTALLNESLTPLENFRRHAPGLGENHYYHQLARMQLEGGAMFTPAGLLSGGERMKTALACALLGAAPQPMLLLDEPTNYLDLNATLALEQALNEYRGTLIVVSHDSHFARSLGISNELVLRQGQ